MKHSLKSIIEDFAAREVRKAEATRQLDNTINYYRETYRTDRSEEFVKNATNEHHEKLKSEFRILGDKLTAELDRMRASVLSDIEAARPENYDLKLSNTLEMLKVLGSRAAEDVQMLKTAVQPFSRDLFARATITKMLNEHKIFAAELFDDKPGVMLEKIETARRFADGYDTEGLSKNMSLYVDMYFSDEEAAV